MSADRIKTLIDEACADHLLTIHGWEEEDGRPQAQLGEYVVAEDVDETMGPFAGEEGVLTACVVGTPAHGNERVAFYFTSEGLDGGDEVAPGQVNPL